MKVSEAALLAVALAIAPMANAVAIWGQCGGMTYNGSTSEYTLRLVVPGGLIHNHFSL